MASKRIVVLGGLNMDLIADLPRPAGPGETVEGTRFYTTPGGKGGNQAVAAGRLAGPDVVEFVGRVGGDSYGREMAAFLSQAGVGVSCLRTDPETASGVAIIFIDATGQNYVNAVYGANARCDSVQVSDVARLVGGGILLVQQEVPVETTLAAMRAARAVGATVILDPAPVRRGLPKGMVQAAHIVTPNQAETKGLTGIAVIGPESAKRAAVAIKATGVEGVIIKMAELGALVEALGMSKHFPAFSVRVVATVGAGDAFNGGLAAGLASGMTPEDSVWLAMATGAMSVTRPGAQESMPSRAEVEQLLLEQRPRL